MTKWLAVSKTRHHNAGWMPYSEYHFTSSDTTCPLLAAEVAHAVTCFPIAFIKHNDNYQLVVLQSLQPNINLYVNKQGQWLAPYMPSWYRSHPLRLLQNNTGEYLLCVDEDSSSFQINSTGEQRLFDAQGNYTSSLSKVLEFLQQCHNNRMLTETLVNQIAEAELIIPWPLQLETGKGQPTPVNGVYQIDEHALRTLPGSQLAVLSQSGALAVAYAQLLSIPRLQDFSRRYRQRVEDQTQEASGEINLDNLFGDQGDSKFSF